MIEISAIVPVTPIAILGVADSPALEVQVAPGTLNANVAVAAQGPAGPPGQAITGPEGPEGPPGPPGATVGFEGGLTYVQNVPSATWTIVHNLGYMPSVTVTDSAGTVVVGDISYPDQNTVVITFAFAFGGTAYLV